MVLYSWQGCNIAGGYVASVKNLKMMSKKKLQYSSGCYKRGGLYSINCYIACYIKVLYNT